jgi:hypothetical protein
MRDLKELFAALESSEFRSSFYLREKEMSYLQSRPLETIIEHGRDFVRKRLGPAEPANDGRQTPMKNHPAFVAQHATGTCCRGCLKKWHKIDKGKPLTEEQIDYIFAVIRYWLEKELKARRIMQ